MKNEKTELIFFSRGRICILKFGNKTEVFEDEKFNTKIICGSIYDTFSKKSKFQTTIARDHLAITKANLRILTFWVKNDPNICRPVEK